MKVIGTLLLASAIAWQDPSPPHVILPEGWHAHYWSSEGFGTGALLGPKGEEIVFPGYEETGAVAETTHETDPRSLYVKAIIDGRRIDVSVRSNGYLAVSYPPLPRPNVPHWRSFDYWTRTRTPGQAANALAIALTRLEVLRSADRDKDDLRKEEMQFAPATTDFPFEALSVALPFKYGGDSKPRRIRFQGERSLVVELQAAPTKLRWEEKRSLAGHELRWGEDSSGRSWAASDVKSAAFRTSEPSAQGMVLAILMALTHKDVGS